jgi:hypothetical protein
VAAAAAVGRPGQKDKKVVVVFSFTWGAMLNDFVVVVKRPKQRGREV